jgi:hypothetical protein
MVHGVYFRIFTFGIIQFLGILYFWYENRENMGGIGEDMKLSRVSGDPCFPAGRRGSGTRRSGNPGIRGSGDPGEIC